VDRIERLAPAACRANDSIGVGSPDEWFRVGVVIGEVAVDRGLQVGEGLDNHVAGGGGWRRNLQPHCGRDAEAGVKWKVQRGWRASQALTLGCHNSVGLQWAELQSGVAVSRLAKLRTSNPGRGPHSIIGPIAVKDAEPGDVVEIRLIPHSPDEAAILSALTDVQG
jgi:hypothetical protein